MFLWMVDFQETKEGNLTIRARLLNEFTAMQLNYLKEKFKRHPASVGSRRRSTRITNPSSITTSGSSPLQSSPSKKKQKSTTLANNQLSDKQLKLLDNYLSFFQEAALRKCDVKVSDYNRTAQDIRVSSYIVFLKVCLLFYFW
jgi:hypothetical protein